MCRINPKVDFAFKKLFGSEENQDLLLSLVNAVIGEERHFTDLILKNPYNLADYQAGKISILDIKACDTQGKWVNVEMQISQDLNFDKRAIYYWAKLVTEQLSEGMMFKELKKTYSINILDFNFIPATEQFHNRYKIINLDTGKDDRLHDMLELHYLELKKFKKHYGELVNPLDRWSIFFTRAHELDKNHLPKELQQEPAIVKAIEAIDRMFNEEERQVYEVRMQSLADVKSQIVSAYDEGMEKGIYQTKQETVLLACQQGMNIEAIAKITQLSEQQIQDILNATQHDGQNIV
jgi:predicted transposase/invertase (TIGR01784 family)